MRNPGRVVAAVLVVTLVWLPASAGAAGDGGASSHVTRDGRIITSILTGRPLRYRGPGKAPASYWVTISDVVLADLFRLFSQHPELDDDPVIGELRRVVDAGVADDVDVQIEVVGGRLTTRTRLIPVTATPVRAIARRMITLLPTLRSQMTPPIGAAVVIGEPTFASFDPKTWATTVDRSLTVGALSARVRAWPVSFVLSGGDPRDDRPVRCSGTSPPFDPADPAPPSAQARRGGSCTYRYRTATGVRGRRARWYGSITVVWHAEWTADGVRWSSLGEIPQVSFFARQVRTATTAIESPS
ncbi:MAG: hypothetical protein JST64_05820 [Actinobacteria bacterium]|nr:hypothetical protein [Actinomycetota bacterium]